MTRTFRIGLGLLFAVSAVAALVLLKPPPAAETTSSGHGMSLAPAIGSFDLTHLFVAGGFAVVALALFASCLVNRK